MTASVGRDRGEAARLLERDEPITDAEFEAIYRRYKTVLVGFAYNASDPEAIADLALLDGYRAMNQFENRNEHTFLAYLKQSARGHMSDDYNRRRRSAVPAEQEVVTVDPADALVDRVWLTELVEQLSIDQRAVIRNRFFNDLDGAQTAALLDKDPNAVYQLQHRALRRLRKLIFAAALVVAVIVGGLVVRQALSGGVRIDSTPAEQPTVPPTTATTPAPRLDDEGADEGAAPATSTIPSAPNADLPDPTSSSGAADQPVEDEASTTDTAPANATSAQTDEVLFLEPPDTCVVHSISPTLDGVALRLVGDDPLLAADFDPPEAIRFLDSGGEVLDLIDTSGPMTTGLTPGTHGWLATGDETGTHAALGTAPRPTAWGVLVTPQNIQGWTTIQYQWVIDGESVWLDIVPCP
ncbi:MAG: sigma-70 family RNA polymerase sigma factor [Actinomycetota bacterium]